MRNLKYILMRIIGLSLVFFIPFLIYFSFCLPNKLFDVDFSPALLSEENRVLSTQISTDQQWRFTAVDSIPEFYKIALMSYEDKRFESHFGIDAIAVVRALISNIKARAVVSGASTISMQVIRLSRQINQRSLFEKVIEAVWALRLEMKYTKKEILQLYTTHAPFGGNVVGLKTASWLYFNHSPKELSWAESALLAVLPNSPSLLHIRKNRDRLLKKRNKLLKELKNRARISDEEYHLSLQEPLPEKIFRSPHLNDLLLMNLKNEGAGKRLQTTINYQLQEQLLRKTKEYSDELSSLSINNIAAVVIDNDDFSVKAYIGNRPMNKRHQNGASLDLVRGVRSTGSTLKPFLYAAMLDKGLLTPEMLIPDIPTHFEYFSPKNFDKKYRGAVSAKVALAQSINIPAVFMLHEYGIAPFLKILHNLNIDGINRSGSYYGLSLIIGGAESTLFSLTNAYANLSALAQNGDRNQEYFHQIAHIERRLKPVTGQKSELSAGAAYLTMQALQSVKRPHFYRNWQDFESQQDIAWKTGTSHGFRDAWAIGSSPKYTVGVWVGNANGEGNRHLVGSKAAAPLLFGFFETLTHLFPNQRKWSDIEKPALKKVDICADDGFKANSICPITETFIPKESHLQSLSPHYTKVFVDKTEKWQVSRSCEQDLHTKVIFNLAAAQEYYYRKYHSNLDRIPPLREDCRKKSDYLEGKRQFSIIYPQENSQIIIPRHTDNSLQKIIFEAIHNDREEKLFWYIDEEFVGETKTYHQINIHLKHGEHLLTLLDKDAQKIERRFTILRPDTEG